MNIRTAFDEAATPWARCVDYLETWERGRSGGKDTGPEHKISIQFETSRGLNHRMMVSCHQSNSPDSPPTEKRRQEMLGELVAGARDWTRARQMPSNFADAE